jgi:hypothetical protein
METLFDTFSALHVPHYVFVLVSVIGIIILCVVMKPDISYFTGSRRRSRRRGMEKHRKDE